MYPTTMCLNQNLRMAGKGVGLGAFVLDFTYFFQRHAREGGREGGDPQLPQGRAKVPY